MEDTKKVCCSGARVWALVIGWFETLVSGLGIQICSVALILLSGKLTENSNNADTDLVLPRIAPEEDQSNLRDHFNESLKAQKKEFWNRLPFPFVGLIVVFLILSVINTVLGYVLIAGVKQEKYGPLKAYIVWHVGLLLIFAMIAVVLMEFTSLASALPVIIGFLVCLFFMWVVNVHRKELLARSLAPVPVLIPVSAA